MNAALVRLDTDRLREPLHALRTRFEHVTAIATHLRLHERLERRVQLYFEIAQLRIREPSQWNMARAARENSDPGLARHADPERTVIVAIGIRLVAHTSERRGRAAIVAVRVRKRFDRS